MNVPSFSTATLPITIYLDIETFPPLQTMPHCWPLAFIFLLIVRFHEEKFLEVEFLSQILLHILELLTNIVKIILHIT